MPCRRRRRRPLCPARRLAARPPPPLRLQGCSLLRVSPSASRPMESGRRWRPAPGRRSTRPSAGRYVSQYLSRRCKCAAGRAQPSLPSTFASGAPRPLLLQVRVLVVSTSTTSTVLVQGGHRPSLLLPPARPPPSPVLPLPSSTTASASASVFRLAPRASRLHLRFELFLRQPAADDAPLARPATASSPTRCPCPPLSCLPCRLRPPFPQTRQGRVAARRPPPFHPSMRT